MESVGICRKIKTNKNRAQSFTFIFFVSAFLADVAMWSSHGTTADLFVKKPAVDGGAAAVLESANVTYSVVIADMQEAIDGENPRPEEIALLQDRKGECDIAGTGNLDAID